MSLRDEIRYTIENHENDNGLWIGKKKIIGIPHLLWVFLFRCYYIPLLFILYNPIDDIKMAILYYHDDDGIWIGKKWNSIFIGIPHILWAFLFRCIYLPIKFILYYPIIIIQKIFYYPLRFVEIVIALLALYRGLRIVSYILLAIVLRNYLGGELHGLSVARVTTILNESVTLAFAIGIIAAIITELLIWGEIGVIGIIYYVNGRETSREDVSHTTELLFGVLVFFIAGIITFIIKLLLEYPSTLLLEAFITTIVIIAIDIIIGRIRNKY